jgi:hypothetical protein
MLPGSEVLAYWHPANSFVLERPVGEGDEPAQYAADPLGSHRELRLRAHPWALE